jgi:hypothetical protein
MAEAAAAACPEDPASPHLRLTPRVGTPRRRVLYAGILADTANRMTWLVTVRELSSHGAQVFLHGEMRTTSHPVLIIPRYGVAISTRMVWQRAGRAGFEFQHRIGLAKPASDDHHWLRALWLEAFPR